MTTIGFVDPRVARQDISRTRACAVAARHCTNTHKIVEMDEMPDDFVCPKCGASMANLAPYED